MKKRGAQLSGGISLKCFILNRKATQGEPGVGEVLSGISPLENQGRFLHVGELVLTHLRATDFF